MARLILSVGAPLVFWLLLELLLRMCGYGYATSFLLPKRMSGREVLVQNDRFTWRFLGPAMGRQPFPLEINPQKAPGTIRIFVLGESAAYGDPQPEFGLSRMLEALLSGRYPGMHFEVVNAAMTAINSHAIVPVARDCATAGGDAWVIYMGNNEVVGPFGAGTVFGSQRANLAVIRASLALKTLRSGQLLDRLLAGLSRSAKARPEWGGMAMFMSQQVRQQDPRMEGVYAHFEHNLREILDVAHRRGVRIAVSTVAANLRECAPFASQHSPQLEPASVADWTKLYEKGAEAQQAGLLADAVESFQQAGKLDDAYAELQYRWGKCCLALGRDAEARSHLSQARDEDTLRFRADSRINDIIRRTSSGREAEGVGFVDGAGILAQASPHGVVGEELLYEHVHLDFEGNYLLARALAEELARLLPGLSVQATLASQWPSAADCARRLGWTDWDRYQAQSAILRRITDPPFTEQLDHRERYDHLREGLEKLRQATAPPGLRLAQQSCRTALAQAPGDWVLNKHLAAVQEQLGDYAGATESWRAVVTSMPYYAEAWESLGRALVEQKREQEAHAAFEHALLLEPESVLALSGLAQIAANEGKYSEAIGYYRAILKQKPYWGPANLGLGKAMEALGRTEEAQQHFRQALLNRLYTPASLRALGSWCFEKGWLNAAVTNFADALKLEPMDAPTELNLGLTLALLGRHQEAQRHYAEALRLDPDLAEAHVRLGFELGRQGADAAALDHFAQAVRLRPELLEARLDLGIALVNQHREQEALAQFQEALRQSPTNGVALKYVRRLETTP
jgi:tetratricopeptide (TPR) repeat protein